MYRLFVSLRSWFIGGDVSVSGRDVQVPVALGRLSDANPDEGSHNH